MLTRNEDNDLRFAIMGFKRNPPNMCKRGRGDGDLLYTWGNSGGLIRKDPLGGESWVMVLPA